MNILFQTPSTNAATDNHSLRLIQSENRILELIATETSRQSILDRIALEAEQLCGHRVMCSILLLDQAGAALLHGSGPSLPDAYNRAIHGVKIGPEVGSCGTAAFTRKAVIVSDIEVDLRWGNLRDLALSHGLRACWSTPIFGSSSELLGTFALYYRQPAQPTEEELNIVTLLSRTAAIAIQNAKMQDDRIRFQEQAEALIQTGLSLTAEHEQEKIVQAATDVATKASGAEFGAFFYNVVNADGESYMLYTLSGVPREAFSRFPMPRNTAVFAPTFEGTAIVRSDDITRDPRYGKNTPRHGMPQGHLPVCSYLAVPVISRSGIVHGGLFFGHSKPGVFKESAEKIVAGIAAQAAIAIDNALLHDKALREIKLHEETQQRLAILQQTAKLAIWEWDTASESIRCNPGSFEVFGVPWSQIKNLEDWFNRIDPDDVPRVRQAVDSALKEQRNYDIEYRTKSPDPRWVMGRGHVIYEVNGAPQKVVVSSMDITDRKRTEVALRRSEERFRQAQAAASIGAFDWDIKTGLVTWSAEVPALREIAADRKRDTWLTHVHPEDQVKVEESTERLFREGKADSEVRLVKPDQTVVWIYSRGYLIRDASGDLAHAVGVAMDVTERKLSQQALVQSEKLASVGRLAATVAHEINNPLEAVTNHIYLAKKHPDLPEKVRRHLNLADQDLARVTHIAQQTLGFYRDNSRPVLLSIQAALRDVLAIYERKFEYKGLRVESDVDEAMQIETLEGELKQLLSNLIANAIDACDAGGRIMIRARGSRRWKLLSQTGARITIGDNGSGMSKEVLSRIFTPFFTTKKDIGTGLGLWVTKNIVEKQDGFIRVRSRNKTPSGTVISIFLPDASPAAAVAQTNDSYHIEQRGSIK